MVVHLETRIVSVFGVLDDNGNVVQRYAFQPGNEPNDPLNISVFHSDNFVKAFTAIANTREQLKVKLAEQSAVGTPVEAPEEKDPVMQ